MQELRQLFLNGPGIYSSLFLTLNTGAAMPISHWSHLVKREHCQRQTQNSGKTFTQNNFNKLIKSNKIQAPHHMKPSNLYIGSARPLNQSSIQVCTDFQNLQYCTASYTNRFGNSSWVHAVDVIQ